MSDSSVDSPYCDPSAELDISNLISKLNISSKENQTSKVVNTISDRSVNNINMAPPIFDVKNLCIVPIFDGNPNNLYEFLNVSTTLLTHYFDVTPANIGCIQNKLLLHGILSKLTGRAKEVISVYGCSDWESIKNTLIQHFGDQRDENALTRDLVNLRQNPNEAPLQFYEKCMGILNTICNYIDLHNDQTDVISSKKDFFRQQTLTTFLAGLKEPLGSTIRAMRPTSLATAMQYIQEENNIRYLQKIHNAQIPAVIKKPIPIQRYPSHQITPPQFQRFPMWQTYQPPQSFPRGPVNLPPRTNLPPQRFFTNQQVFGKQQNAWAPKNHPGPSHQPKPTPMSISTRNTVPANQYRNQNHFKPNPHQKPTFTSEELFNLEQYEQNYIDPYQNNYNYYSEDYPVASIEEETEEFECAQEQNFQDEETPQEDT